MAKHKRPDPKKHSDINIPEKDIRREKDSDDFNEALKKVIEKGEDANKRP